MPPSLQVVYGVKLLQVYIPNENIGPLEILIFLKRLVLAHRITGSGESTTHQSCRPRSSTTEAVRPHALWLELEEEGEQRIHTQYKHQRWLESCIGDGTSELSLLSFRGSLFIQLYPSSLSRAHMLQQ